MILTIANDNYLKKILDKLDSILEENGPTIIEVKKELVPQFVFLINKKFYLYRVIEKTNDKIVYVVSIPENYLKFDKEVDKYSTYLLDINTLRKVIEKGKAIESGVIHNPNMMIKYFHTWSVANKRLVLLSSRRLSVRGAVLFVNGLIRASWVDEVEVLIGKKAIRSLLYYGPYNYVLFNIE